MRPVSDAFLLNVAEVSATLVGLFVVGVFFYAESGFRQLDERVRVAVQPYLRASTTIVLVLFAIPLLLSLGLVALDPPWTMVLFVVLSVLLVVTNIDTVRRIRSVAIATRSRTFVANEVVGTVAVALIVVLPWVLGGLAPTREHLTWAIVLSFVTGFLSVATLLLSVFDATRWERPPTTAAARRATTARAAAPTQPTGEVATTEPEAERPQAARPDAGQPPDAVDRR